MDFKDLKEVYLLMNCTNYKENLVVVKSNFLHLLADRNHLLALDEIYVGALRSKEDEVDKLTLELKGSRKRAKSADMEEGIEGLYDEDIVCSHGTEFVIHDLCLESFREPTFVDNYSLMEGGMMESEEDITLEQEVRN